MMPAYFMGQTFGQYFGVFIDHVPVSKNMFLQTGGLATIPNIGAEVGYYFLFIAVRIISVSLQHKL